MMLPEILSPLAYIGPGLGAATVATILGLIGAFFLGLFAILWYPIKRMLKGKKKAAKTEETPDAAPGKPAEPEQ